MTHARLSIVLDADFGCDSSPGRKGHYDPRTSNQLMISVALLAILIDHEGGICRPAIQMVQEGSDSPVVVAKRPSRGAPKYKLNHKKRSAKLRGRHWGGS